MLPPASTFSQNFHKPDAIGRPGVHLDLRVKPIRPSLTTVVLLGATSDGGDRLVSIRCQTPAMVRVIAHRGASAAAPENTIEAFHLARELGADWVELDARRTGDGVVVVHHDAHLTSVITLPVQPT
jgi:glycerophosphoryl diester phosphodiesterase